jgi:hypothetical protein
MDKQFFYNGNNVSVMEFERIKAILLIPAETKLKLS